MTATTSNKYNNPGIALGCNKKVVLSHREPRDAAVNIDTYRILQ